MFKKSRFDPTDFFSSHTYVWFDVPVYVCILCIQGFVTCTSSIDGPTFEESVILLDHLCHEALATVSSI